MQISNFNTANQSDVQYTYTVGTRILKMMLKSKTELQCAVYRSMIFGLEIPFIIVLYLLIDS